jgi:hypothetical protein
MASMNPNLTKKQLKEIKAQEFLVKKRIRYVI